MLIFLVIILVNTLFYHGTQVVALQRLHADAYRNSPRMRVYLKPNGSNWEISSYGCGDSQCHRTTCRQTLHSNDVASSSSCTHQCHCIPVMTFVTNVLPSNCRMSNEPLCKDVCIKNTCKELCINKIVKKCEYLTG